MTEAQLIELQNSLVILRASAVRNIDKLVEQLHDEIENLDEQLLVLENQLKEFRNAINS